MKRLRLLCGAAAAAVAVAIAGMPAVSNATDSFYAYQGEKPLSSYAPGAVLKTRTVPYHLLNVPTPINALQILYRSTDAMGEATANVTSVLQPPVSSGPAKVISFQSFYDSLNPEDSPSRVVAGNAELLGFTPLTKGLNENHLLDHVRSGGIIATTENTFFDPLLLAGFTIVLPDTEGQSAHFAAGPEYGKLTLDSLRAARNVAATGITDSTKIGLMGYSGGSIASNWAAIEAPSYAPDVNKNLIGVAEGGVLVNPAHNMTYASGSFGWAGIVGMAVVGIARSYHIDFDKYLNDYGKENVARLQNASISNAFLQYAGLRFDQMVKPQYANPNSIPEYVEAANKINMGTAPIPTVPMFIAQGTFGILEGTQAGPPGVGAGDGIMVAGDVRALANRYCDAGLKIHYDQYDTLSHVPSAMLWYPGAVGWLLDRFAGNPAPSNCGHIPAGNSLAPQQLQVG
ncbi:triacylglycerol lipase [Antrihabitans cavernicola]|uniref:Triacylglycerol lipase n=2 Tax=Antrihabitans cavernicola TaxID=2495913 RepID=A0A5A7SHB8_9NOCA|nr:lipase family protein [Spelaeibacter cavernicola]KAA0024799.1 triacylglycerol lipase [Spelaeibacter cavernicola]